MNITSLEHAAFGQSEALTSNKNLHCNHESLVRRQCGEVEVEISRNRTSGFIQGHVLRKSRPAVPITICGLPKRFAEIDELPLVKRLLEEAAIKIQGDRIEVRPRLLGGMNHAKTDEVERVYKEISQETNINTLLSGLKTSTVPEAYFKRIGEVFCQIEGEIKEGKNLENLLRIEPLRELAKSDRYEISIRAIDNFIGLLESDFYSYLSGNASRFSKADNLLNVCQDFTAILEREIQIAFDTTKVEKLMEALGLTLKAILVYHSYEKSGVSRFSKEYKENIEKCVDNIRSHLDEKARSQNFRYHLNYLHQGIRHLKTDEKKIRETSKRLYHIVKDLVKIAGAVKNYDADQSFEALEDLTAEAKNLICELSQKKRSWYLDVIIARDYEKFIEKNPTQVSCLLEYLQQQKHTGWEWAYTKVNIAANLQKNGTLFKAAKTKDNIEKCAKSFTEEYGRKIQSQALEIPKTVDSTFWEDIRHCGGNGSTASAPVTAPVMTAERDQKKEAPELLVERGNAATTAVPEVGNSKKAVKSKRVRIFISYDYAGSKEAITDLKKEIEEEFSGGEYANYPIMFKEEAKGLADWQAFIHKEIQRSDLVILYVTEEYLKSDFCIGQFFQATKLIDEKQWDKKMRILCDSNMNGLFANRQKWFKFFNECGDFWEGEHETLENEFKKAKIGAQMAMASEREYLYRNRADIPSLIQGLRARKRSTIEEVKKDIRGLIDIKKNK